MLIVKSVAALVIAAVTVVVPVVAASAQPTPHPAHGYVLASSDPDDTPWG